MQPTIWKVKACVQFLKAGLLDPKSTSFLPVMFMPMKDQYVLSYFSCFIDLSIHYHVVYVVNQLVYLYLPLTLKWNSHKIILLKVHSIPRTFIYKVFIGRRSRGTTFLSRSLEIANWHAAPIVEI